MGEEGTEGPCGLWEEGRSQREEERKEREEQGWEREGRNLSSGLLQHLTVEGIMEDLQ